MASEYLGSSSTGASQDTVNCPRLICALIHIAEKLLKKRLSRCTIKRPDWLNADVLKKKLDEVPKPNASLAAILIPPRIG